MYETLTLDINGTSYANLPIIEFEGATKRNKPKVEVGDLIFA